MRSHRSTVSLRVFLLGALGALGCDISSRASDGEMGAATDTGEQGQEGQGENPSAPYPCSHEEPLIAGTDTGIFSCGEGYLHRAEVRTCASELPRDRNVDFPAIERAADAGAGEPPYTTTGDECSRDTDCGDALSRCELKQTNAPDVCSRFPSGAPNYARICVRGCQEDSDCGADAVCVCSSPIGYCLRTSEVAGCQSDADCDGDALCLSNAHTDRFAEYTFACELPGDTCNRDADCNNGLYCDMSEQGRSCRQGSVCGRPFLVEAEARLASVCVTDGWLGADECKKVSSEEPNGVSPELARALAKHWSEIGLMEHASIAAFARFTLQLLGMGAPSELIEASNRAQADETRHARIAFELASRYSGSPVGPGPLSLSGTLLDPSWESILRTTIDEGCIGETCAALEAALAADLATDPAVARLLGAIAEDEGRHAALAWRTTQWMLAERPSLRPFAERVFAEAAERVARVDAAAIDLAETSDAERHGALDPARRAACQSRGVREVVMPCARTLLEAARLTCVATRREPSAAQV